MSGLCRECDYWLYDKPKCKHQFEEGKCLQCGWDGSTSEYVSHIKLNSQRKP